MRMDSVIVYIAKLRRIMTLPAHLAMLMYISHVKQFTCDILTKQINVEHSEHITLCMNIWIYM